MKKLSILLALVSACVFMTEAQALNRDIKCSDDGRVCLECFYKDNGDLLYCDIWILPKLSSQIFQPVRPLTGKTKSFSVRSAPRTRDLGHDFLNEMEALDEAIDE